MDLPDLAAADEGRPRTRSTSSAHSGKYCATIRRRNASDSAISSMPFMPSSMLTQPAVAVLGQDAEDRVVVVQPLARDAVPQVRASSRACRRPGGARRASPLGEVAVAGVHAHDPVGHGLQQLDRVVAGDDRVGATLKQVLGEYLYKTTRRRPMIIPVVTEL